MVLNYGLKVAKAGANVLTESDKDLQFTSKYSALKIIPELSGNASFTTNGSGYGSVTISHNLKFAPAFFVWRKCTAAWSFMDATTYPNSFIPIGCGNGWGGWNTSSGKMSYHQYIHAYTTTTDLVIYGNNLANSTTYYFRYYILIDKAQDFSGNEAIDHASSYGFKVAKQGIDVKTAKEYELAYSSKYKALQYYDESFKTETLTLPAMFASVADTDTEEGTYVDIYHGLGYPPFFMAYAKSTDFTNINLLAEIPFCSNNTNWAYENYMISSFCDSTRIRISFWRNSQYLLGGLQENWSEGTINIKCIPFTENLLGNL